MVVSEFRVGNYVESLNGKLMQICLSDFVEEYETGQAFFHTKPIQLTSEWFQRFGFNYNDLNGDSGYWQLKYGTRVGLFEILQGEEMFLYDQTELKIVHQLQNLFFALEGAELTLKK